MQEAVTQDNMPRSFEFGKVYDIGGMMSLNSFTATALEMTILKRMSGKINCPVCDEKMYVGKVLLHGNTPTLFCDCDFRVGIPLVITAFGKKIDERP